MKYEGAVTFASIQEAVDSMRVKKVIVIVPTEDIKEMVEAFDFPCVKRVRVNANVPPDRVLVMPDPEDWDREVKLESSWMSAPSLN